MVWGAEIKRGALPEDLAMGFVLALIWGSTFPVVRVAGNPALVLLGRYAISSIISIAVLMRLRGALAGRVGREILKILVSGFLNALFTVCMYYALLYIPSGPVSAIVYTYPLMILLISLLTGYRGIGSKVILGSLVAFTGVLTIYAPSRLDEGGVILSLIAAVLFATSSVISSRIPLNQVIITAMQSLIGLPIAIATYMLMGSGLELDVMQIVAVLHQGLGASFLAYIIWYRLLSRSVGIASSMVYMVPATSYMIAVPIAGEVPSIYQILGLVLILIGIYIARR